jgi:hypothetical protein
MFRKAPSPALPQRGRELRNFLKVLSFGEDLGEAGFYDKN